MSAACPSCGDERTSRRWTVRDRVYETTGETFSLWQCAACGVFFLEPPPRPEDLPRYYPRSFWRGGEAPGGEPAGLRGRLTEGYRRLVLRDHARFVGRVVREQKASGLWRGLLDVGCGDGSTLEALNAHPCVGLDTAEDAVQHVAARGLRVVRAAPEAAPFAPGSFSVVTMFHFLEHVRPPEPHLDAVRSLLSEGGELIVQVPNADGLGARLLGRRWHGFDPPRHLVDYGPAALRRVLGRAGFEVVAESHFCLRDNPATLATSLAPGLYPPARAARGHTSRGTPALAADLAYLALTVLLMPLALAGSAAGRGESVMMRCRPRR